MSILTDIDLLITNMIVSSRLDASFPVKIKEMSKLRCNAAVNAQRVQASQRYRRHVSRPKAAVVYGNFFLAAI